MSYDCGCPKDSRNFYMTSWAGLYGTAFMR